MTQDLHLDDYDDVYSDDGERRCKIHLLGAMIMMMTMMTMMVEMEMMKTRMMMIIK